MNKVFVLKDNSPEIREEIRKSGIDVCFCASFDEAIWLDYNTLVGSVHGIGYHYEGMTWEETINMIRHEWEKHNTEVVVCWTHEDFIEEILKSKNGSTQK